MVYPTTMQNINFITFYSKLHKKIDKIWRFKNMHIQIHTFVIFV